MHNTSFKQRLRWLLVRGKRILHSPLYAKQNRDYTLEMKT